MPGRVKKRAAPPRKPSAKKTAAPVTIKSDESDVTEENISNEEENDYELEIARKRAEVKAALNNLRLEVGENNKDLIAAHTKLAAVPARKRKARTGPPAEPTRKSSRMTKKPELFSLEVFSDEEGDSDNSGNWSGDSYGSDMSDNGGRLKGERGIRRSKQMKAAARRKGPSERRSGALYGPIPGIEVGTWWSKRDECGRTGVHPPTVAGIYGGSDRGAFSVAVSAGYPEDVDNGDSFTYTGSGGRELKTKNLRTAPQSKDQVLERSNLALYKSAESGKPVRVIRGFKAKLGPVTGYRYDGLYKVERAYEAKNSNGKFKVWKFDFVRLPGQPPVDYGHKEKFLKEQAKKEAEAARKAKKEEEEMAKLKEEDDKADDEEGVNKAEEDCIKKGEVVEVKE